MAKKVNKKYEFFKPSKFCESYPARAKVLDDGVLSKYVSCVLVDRSNVARGSTYLLMTSSMYKKACHRFALMTDDFEMLRYEIAASLREQAEISANGEATIAALREELAEYRAHQKMIEENRLLANKELSAVMLLKRELQQLIEHLKIGDSEALSLIRGVFERIENFALNKFVWPVLKLPRYAK